MDDNKKYRKGGDIPQVGLINSNNNQFYHEHENFLQHQTTNNHSQQSTMNGSEIEQSENVANRSRGTGLVPSDRQEVYKRASTRSSRRSRLERASYLVATGHLDISETQKLASNDRHDYQLQQADLLPQRAYSENNNDYLTSISQQQQQTSFDGNEPKTSTFKPTPMMLDSGSGLPLDSVGSLMSGDNSLLQTVSSDHYGDFQSGLFANKNLKNQSNIFNSNMKNINNFKNQLNNSQERAKFKQTYTEVTLPMKTSPAFDYIIHDNKRRNKRCCLWLVYSILMTICVAIIIYCTLQLVIKYHII